MQQSNGLRRDQRRLFGGFCHHRISGHQCRRYLPCKDRQRKIPWRYRDKNAAAAQLEHIALAGRPRHGFALAEQLAALRGIVAAEIDGFADFRKRIIERLAALALQQRDEMRTPLLQQVCGSLQDFRAHLGWRPAPGFESLARGGDGLVRVLRRRIGDASDDCFLVDRADDLSRGACSCLAIDQRRCRNSRGFRRDGGKQSAQRRALAEFDAARILALRSIEIARQADFRMPCIAGGADDIGGAPQQRRNRHGIVSGNRHE